MRYWISGYTSLALPPSLVPFQACPHSFPPTAAPIPFRQRLCSRWSDFTVVEKLRVAVGTWNVNGGTRIRSIALKHQSLSDWLLDGPRLSGAAKEHVRACTSHVWHMHVTCESMHVTYMAYCMVHVAGHTHPNEPLPSPLQPEEFMNPPDIYAIGFEELVGLTASNIVSASSSNRKEWGAELQKVLSRDQPYELLTAEQLVGVCLYVFINPKFIPYIR